VTDTDTPKPNMEMHRHGSVDGYGAGAPSDQSVDDMELVADLEHGTPPPGTDNTHAWQSETCTGTSDDGSSSAANERDSSDGNMPTVRRPFQNVLGLPYGYGKAQRPSHSSHRSQVDRGVKPWPRSGSIQPLQAHGTYPFDGSRDTHEGTPFFFLEESDSAHKRKISKVSSAHQYESYQTGNHTEGNAEASHRSRNEVWVFVYLHSVHCGACTQFLQHILLLLCCYVCAWAVVVLSGGICTH